MSDPAEGIAAETEAEADAIRRRRLHIRSIRRGIREMDLILADFAGRELAGMSPAELDAYEDLLSEADPDLYRWISGEVAPPARHADLVARIAAGATGVAARMDRAAPQRFD